MQDKDTFNDFIQELIDKNDILEVVRGYVDLTRKGNSYWGRCPFHHEKTASFHVEERLKIYKCFGCGAAGNVIKFIQEIESVSFMEAVKILADRAGMKVPEFHHRNKDENLGEKKEKQEIHYKICASTARYYHTQLVHNEKMMDYLLSHGIDKGTITAYGIGYSPNHAGLVTHLIGLGYSEKDVEDAGVCYTSENDKMLDVMAGRIICPHINTFGKVAGFAGSKRDGSTIYTKNTDIFRRDGEVFGTHLLKAIKMEEGIDQLIVTSTPINAVALRARGMKKVVSVMDDEISTRQSRALMRYTSKFIVLFSDVKGGIDKNFAGIDMLVAEGGGVKIATLIEHVYVMDVQDKKIFDRLIKRIKGAKSLLEYQLDILASHHDLKTKDGKDAFIDEAKAYVMTIKERSKQEPYISVISSIAHVREDSIRKTFYEDVDKSNAGMKRVTGKKGKDYNAMMTLLGYVSIGENIGEDLSPYLEGEYLSYYNAVMNGESVELAVYFNDSEIAKLHEVDSEDKNKTKIISDCLKTLKEHELKRQRDEIVKKIEEESDNTKKLALINELNELTRASKKR